MPVIISLLILFIACLHLYHNWRIQPHSLYLSFALAIIALMFVTHYYFLFGASVTALAILFIHFTPLHLLLGPFLLFYVRGTLRDRYRLKPRDAWHFVPALLDLISRGGYMLKPWSYKMAIAAEMVEDVRRLHEIGNQFFPPTQIALPLRFVSMIGYTIFAGYLIFKFRRHYSEQKRIPAEEAQPVIRFLGFMLGACLLAEASFLILTIRFFRYPELGATYFTGDPLLMISALGIISIPVWMQLFPQILYGIPKMRESANATLERSAKATTPLASIPEIDASVNTIASFMQLADAVKHLMQTEQPYLDPNFSLEDLATRMEVPRHHLYYCFNNHLKTKFTQLRSAYRVKHAQGLIQQGATREKTLEAIGMESGFATRGTFISTFRELTGMTPGDYQRKVEAGENG